MSKEYECLRQEILQWQQRRFFLLSSSIVVVTAVFGLGKGGQSLIPSDFMASILIIFLSVACYITAYCGRSSARMGAFIQVYYEEDTREYCWETENSKFSDKYSDKFNLNSNLSVIYVVLGFAALIAPAFLFKMPVKLTDYIVSPLLFLSAFIPAVLYLSGSQGIRRKYVEYWKEIKTENQ